MNDNEKNYKDIRVYDTTSDRELFHDSISSILVINEKNNQTILIAGQRDREDEEG